MDLRRFSSATSIIGIELALRRAHLTRGALVVAEVATVADAISAAAEFPRIALVLADADVLPGWALTVARSVRRRWPRATVAVIAPTDFSVTWTDEVPLLDVTHDWARALAQAADLVDL